MQSDLELAFRLVDMADAQTLRWWSETGVESTTKRDGTPVTEADVAAETAMLTGLRDAHPEDGFLGEEVGEYAGTSGRRWIADGIDGTRFFAAGAETWGTLLALEVEGAIVLGINSSPVQGRRWWAERGAGAFAGTSDGSTATRINVSRHSTSDPDRLVCLPAVDALDPAQRQIVERLAGGRPVDRPWSHQNLVAEGEVDVCVWFAGDIWDHAAPSIIVEEAGGRFTDHLGGRRLDTRAAIYSNGRRHDHVLAALAPARGPVANE
ncbi:MAG: inositol monophosphatase family protein [Acidimicrobiales bacterium]